MSLWQPPAALNALKTSIGMVIAWGIALAMDWPQPFMAPIAVLVLQTPYLGASLLKGALRVVGTLAGALLVLALLSELAQEPWALIASLSLIIGFCVQRIPNSTYGYAWFMLAITVAVIAFDAASSPALAFQLAVYRSSETIVGVLVALAVNGILWPQTGGLAYAQRFDTAKGELAAHLRALATALRRERDASLTPPPESLRAAPFQLRAILAAAALDSGRFGRLKDGFEAQIQDLTSVIGSLMALGESLRLALEGERPPLTAEQRALLGPALDDLAATVEALPRVNRRGANHQARQDAPPALQLATAAHERLLSSADDPPQTGPRPAGAPVSGRDVALRHAAAAKLDALLSEVRSLSESSRAVAAERPPRRPTPRPAVIARVGLGGHDPRHLEGLPQALTATLAFWLVMLLWTQTQWPPVGTLGVLMAVVLVGIETMINRPVQQPGRHVALGAMIGFILVAPLYTSVLPRLDGFAELALVLLPLYFPILYLRNTLAPPLDSVALGTGLVTVIMLQLTPTQTYDITAWLGAALSMLTGFVVSLVLLGIIRGRTPQAQLRRSLDRLFEDMHAALLDLGDHRRPDFDPRLQAHLQRIRSDLEALREVAPLAHVGWAPQNDPECIQRLLCAAQTLVIRFRALQQARYRWRFVGTDAPNGRTQGARHDASAARPTNPSPPIPGATTLGLRFRQAFDVVLAGLKRSLERPYPEVDLGCLDALRASLRPELDRLAAEHAGATGLNTATYLLTIYGHYVGVSRALRETAAAVDDIDWAIWARARF